MSSSDSTNTPPIPYGYCHCGCGEKTKISKYTSAPHCRFEGEPNRFLQGHRNARPVSDKVEAEHRQWWIDNSDGIPYGYCWCGCGKCTNLASQNHSGLGYVRGLPVRYVSGHHNRNRHPYEVDSATGCWNWLHSLNGGYGRLGKDNRAQYAHRVFYEKAKGRVPEGLQLDHLCRNRACVNPDHLEPVTAAVNVHRGSNTRLTKSQVRAMRQLASKNIAQHVIAKKFGVSQRTVSRIVRGESWIDN